MRRVQIFFYAKLRARVPLLDTTPIVELWNGTDG